MQLVWLVTAILMTAAYHLVLKATPAAASPFLSLAVTYLIGSGAFFAIYVAMPGPFALRPSLHELNWTALGLAAAVVFLDLAFLMLYRSGFNVSFGQLVTQSCAALVLLVLGVVLFREKLSAANVGGIVLCVAGLWLISRR
ncbi:MAG TPA: EamA family transporter [Steroidobacteraceae bacterium]|jgi:drug/metabolite transporter (DMT)-like permease|nr:EamA family transporter [Steroidobacteraceae bacterium]